MATNREFAMLRSIGIATATAAARKIWRHSSIKYAVRHVRVKLGEIIAGEEMIHRDEIVDRLNTIEGFIGDLRHQPPIYAAPESPSKPPLYRVDQATGEVEMVLDEPLTDAERLSDPDGWCQGDVPDLK
jgi:hypothetical protein